MTAYRKSPIFWAVMLGAVLAMKGCDIDERRIEEVAQRDLAEFRAQRAEAELAEANARAEIAKAKLVEAKASAEIAELVTACELTTGKAPGAEGAP
jgi:hypothetical protein